MLKIYAINENFETYENGQHDAMIVGMYLHGWLQDANKYDLCTIGDPEFLVDCGPGIYPCSVIMIDGFAVEGLLFMWTAFGMCHGLVVDKNDKEGVRYAMESILKRKPIL